jgi:hypothetical protein
MSFAENFTRPMTLQPPLQILLRKYLRHHLSLVDVMLTQSIHELGKSMMTSSRITPINLSCFTLTLALTSFYVQAENWLSAGKAPSSKGGGFSLAANTKTSKHFGLGLGIVFNGEIAGNEVLDYHIPHNNYSSLGTQRTGNAIGFDLLWFPGDNSAWRPYAGAGLYYEPRAEVAHSNATGWNYVNEEKSVVRGGFDVGIQHRRPGGALLGLGFHSIRGAYLSLGW